MRYEHLLALHALPVRFLPFASNAAAVERKLGGLVAMAVKAAACTLGKHHSWEWQRNTTIRHCRGQTVHLKLVGLYRCACLQYKYGELKPVKMQSQADFYSL